ncbi:MAG TPA: hypothetical protein DCL86_08185 [Bacteroidales bacterium]|jgi:hypothetical protein|nr:hypothetical protein [Bacteroidales bacterium]
MKNSSRRLICFIIFWFSLYILTSLGLVFFRIFYSEQNSPKSFLTYFFESLIIFSGLIVLAVYQWYRISTKKEKIKKQVAKSRFPFFEH